MNTSRIGVVADEEEKGAFHEMLSFILSIILLFVGTNVDDLIFLTAWFSQAKTTGQKLCIVAGQYLGFMLLLALSLIGAFGVLEFSGEQAGLLGLIPIYLGIKSLMDLCRARRESTRHITWVFKTAAITFANGADNIGVYIPLFTAYHFESMIIMMMIFLAFVAVWCYLGNSLAKQPILARIFEHYGQMIVPFVFIGLGIFILIKQGTLGWFL